MTTIPNVTPYLIQSTNHKFWSVSKTEVGGEEAHTLSLTADSARASKFYLEDIGTKSYHMKTNIPHRMSTVVEGARLYACHTPLKYLGKIAIPCEDTVYFHSSHDMSPNDLLKLSFRTNLADEESQLMKANEPFHACFNHSRRSKRLCMINEFASISEKETTEMWMLVNPN